MTAIERLRAMEAVGNAFADRMVLQLAHEIATDEEQPLAIRYEALSHMDRVIGMDPLDLNDATACADALADYLEAAKGL